MRNLGKLKRVVIKIGTAVISDSNGTLKKNYFPEISRQVDELRRKGMEVILVSSGALGAGLGELGIKTKPRDIKTRQMCCSVGQALLMERYRKHFDKYDIKISQILLTYSVFEKRNSFLNLRNCVEALLKKRVVPIFNENDVVSIDEIDESFGDNDFMSALIATNFNADALIMLSSVDGLYTKNPKSKYAKLVKEVHEVTPDIVGSANGSSLFGSGGMSSKLESAKKCMGAGVTMIVVDGEEKNIILRALSGENVGTIFHPENNGNSSKEKWIMTTKEKGKIIINTCAVDALKEGKNLLPVGIETVSGNFSEGDIVSVECSGKKIAKLITNYDSNVLQRFKGKSTKEVKGISNVNTKGNLVLIT